MIGTDREATRGAAEGRAGKQEGCARAENTSTDRDQTEPGLTQSAVTLDQSDEETGDPIWIKTTQQDLWDWPV